MLQRFDMSDCKADHAPVLKGEETCTEEINDSKFPYCDAVRALM